MNGTFPQGNQAGFAPGTVFEEVHECGQEIQAIFRVRADRFRWFGRFAKKLHFWLLPNSVSPVELFRRWN
jgi:hypothetical protein